MPGLLGLQRPGLTLKVILISSMQIFPSRNSFSFAFEYYHLLHLKVHLRKKQFNKREREGAGRVGGGGGCIMAGKVGYYCSYPGRKWWERD